MTLRLQSCRRWGNKLPIICESNFVIIWLFPYIWVSSLEWKELNPLSSRSLHPPNKDDSKGPKCRAKISLFPWLPATPHSPGNPARRRPVLRLRFRELLLRTSPTQSPLSEAQRCWMVGWEPGLSGPDEGAWHRAWNSVRVLRLLVDCAISTVGTGYLINCDQKRLYGFLF